MREPPWRNFTDPTHLFQSRPLWRQCATKARGGEIEIRIGNWKPERLAIREFDNLQQIQAWLESPEYTSLDDIRSRSSNINMVIVDGL